MVRDITIEDFDYSLPESQIPLHPLPARDECKLLVFSPGGRIYHRVFKELPDLLPPGALLVCNDTKVINARLAFHKDSGAAIELFLLEPSSPSDYALNFQSREVCRWKCLVGNSKKWKEGEIRAIVKPINGCDEIIIKARRIETLADGASVIEFRWDKDDYTFGQILEIAGRIPIPPYLNRESEESDLIDYQTVYARVKGSVAAPTAGLHFTPRLFDSISAHAVPIMKVTLHVGAGTFRPVKSSSIGEHEMHAEPFNVTRSLLNSLIEWKRRGRPVVAVGTTTVRTLESLPYIGRNILQGVGNYAKVEQWQPYASEDFDTLEALKAILAKMDEDHLDSISASTSIMIAPGFKWRIVDCIVTNFHQPKSTLLLLVASFIGEDKWRPMYEEALREGYRFLSYGDACLLVK
ncbi:MAG: S-adenosylmethionine:tRNA ribosyltransferase-isomerase [Muribaculaceae bacterium]|nr:S-adenosylmethionine:tRNA ribosyltransferase-isomerase [Muribaculaceae bacterium]